MSLMLAVAISASPTAALAAPTSATANPGVDADATATTPKVTTESDAVPAGQRDAVLGAGWQQSSDVAWTTAGDAEGFHVLTANAARGYAWQTIATLSEPGVETDSWIGNACVTGSGKRAVLVYAPRTFTNDDKLSARGGFTAVIDLTNGSVTKLPVRSTLAYFSPSCGTGEDALLTQEGSDDLGRTRLVRVDAAAAKISQKIEVAGQLTSAVPTPDGIVAADSGAVVSVDATGTRRRITSAEGVPFKLAVDADGGVVYLERSGAARVAVKRVASQTSKSKPAAAAATTIATGSLTDIDLTTPRGGRVFVTGNAKATSDSAAFKNVSVVKATKGSQLSMQGKMALTALPTQADPRSAVPNSAPRQLQIKATVLDTGKPTAFAVTPSEAAFGEQGPNAGRTLSPSLSNGPSAPALGGDAHDAADLAQRYCSVPRNDPANQAMQPRPRQVEWAVDQAVRQALTVERPANWKNLAMPAYNPQELFPPIDLDGGGFIPAQVMLGIAAQESNLWQAARFAVPGVTANPLIGNYYGVDIYNGDPNDDWDIHWADADCGYGVTQQTDGMRLAGHEKPGETALKYQTQRAVALDFAANIAAGARTLESKWNETRTAGMQVNNGDASKLENWFYAIWDYNSGFHANTGGPWGLGWANNPANPHYPANRTAFLDTTYQDAAHPQDWPYPEKVLGWAGHPVEVLDSPDNLIPGYRYASWPGGDVEGPVNRTNVKPPVNQFCDSSDNCQPGAHYPPNAPEVVGEPAGPCAHQNANGQYDLQCWYHQSSTWKPDCSATCGVELLRFDPGYAYQDDGTAYPPRCDLSGLPANPLIVDDVPDTAISIRPNCPKNWSNSGAFTFTFKQDSHGEYPGKIDTHQLGAGFGGHFWFTHTRTNTDNGGKLEVDGSWRLNQSHNGPMEVFISLPDHGAQTNAATYVVKTASGDRTRVVHQPGDGNRWVPLGAFMFNNVPEVDLSSVTPNGDGSQDIAFDAVAFVPVNGKYHEDSVEADALFDENQNIDTAAPESWLAGPLKGRQALYDWATTSADAILKLPACPPEVVGECLLPHVKQAVSAWRDQVQSAGTDPINHPAGNSIARWIGFANSYQDRPATDQRPASFDDDSRYKIRIKATVTFVTGPDGKVIAGSEGATYEHRTGNTHIPRFFLDLVQAISDDYSIARPDLSYRMPDLNHHDGEWTTVNPYSNGGFFPGRAYTTVGKAPVPVDSSGAPSTSSAVCVAALANAGGSIGYRPMLSQSGPLDAMTAWVNELQANPAVDKSISDLADSLRSMFFHNGIVPVVGESIFGIAPPIWQELNLKVCADDSVQTVSGRPILRSSWMPDQYLYFNGQAIDTTGAYVTSNKPIETGDFNAFSKSGLLGIDTAFGSCDAATERSGNPWSIGFTDSAGINPDAAHFCLDSNIQPDPAFSG